MALTQEQVTLISVAAFGVAPGEVHSKYFLDSDAAGKFVVGRTETEEGKQIHEVLGLKEPLTGTAAVAAVLAHEYNYLVVTKGLEEVSNAEFVKNTAKNLGADLGAENSKTLEADLDSGMPRYEALAKFAQAEADKAGGIEKVAGFITALENDKTIDSVAEDLLGSAVKPEEPNPEVDGKTYVLTEGRDTKKDFTGTADNDRFIADAGQNSLGMITNALSTGDRLDGGAGTDRLDVTLVADESFNTTMAVRPVTDSIENVFINALAQGDFGANNSTDVTSNTRLNADQMSDLEQIWSNGSEGSLRVENVKNPGETADLIIGMRSTGNKGANRSESNYEVYFQEQELTAGSTGEGSFFYNILNQAAWNQDSTAPVKGFPLDSLRFDISFGGAKAVQFRVQLEDGDMKDINTHTQLVSLLNDKLATMRASDARLDGLDFVVKGTFNDGDGRNNIDQIRLVDSKAEGRELVGGTTKLNEEAPSGNLYWDQGAQGTQISNEPITATIILDDVGRGSAGGSLTVGSMSQVSKTSTGVEVFDIKVQNSSSLSGLYTTNTDTDKDFAKKAKSILITSDGNATGSLKIGNENSTGKVKVVENNLKAITTSGFNGDLSLGTATNKFLNTERLDAVIAGNVTFNAEVNNKDNDSTVYSYNTGSGADTVDVILNTDTIDRTDTIDPVKTGLTINTSAGDDNIRLDSKTLANKDDASQLTMAKLNNVKVNAGSGDDFVKVVGDVRANIDAGAGSDFVVINSDGAAQDIKDASKDIYGGSWNFGSASASQGPGFAEQVLYNAELTVTFAGFESKVKVPTDAAGNFVANQLVINQAIRNAIAESPELARLLKVTNQDGSQQITVESTVAGANALTVKIDQPNAVVANAVTGEVQISTGDLLALQKGLIATKKASNSDDVNSIEAVATKIGGGTSTVLKNTVEEGSTSTEESNFSVINMGGGSNDKDLLVLDSNLGSSNIIKIDEGFGKVSVVNFHNQNDNTGSIATNIVGKHAIDFTSILDNTADSSANDNNLSEKDVAVTLNTAGGSAVANSVNMLKFTESTADKAVKWNNLTAKNLVDVLNGVPDAAPVGSLTASSLSATATANLVQSTQKHIVMLENQANLGEYKVFKLTSTLEEDGTVKDNAFSGAELLGTLDFGASINFNLVGSTAFDEGIYKELLHNADGIPTEAPSEEPTEEPTDHEQSAVVGADGIANVKFEGTEAADVFTVTLDETAAGLDLGQITITDFGANDQLVLSKVYEGGFDALVDLGDAFLKNPVIKEINSEGNLELTLMKAIDVANADIDVWTITFENADQTIIDKALAGDFTDWLLF